MMRMNQTKTIIQDVKDEGENDDGHDGVLMHVIDTIRGIISKKPSAI